jgi:hypothetical protein
MGQRSREKQAKLFFDKLMSTGGRPRFFKEEPIPYIDPVTGETKRDCTLTEWRGKRHLPERVKRVLKYSALPSVSRHHWGTDVDIESVEPKMWQAGGRLHGLGTWLEAHRDTLPLKTTYSGDRDGGYLDEPWHLTMDGMGQALHARFNAQVGPGQLIRSIEDAFVLWSKGSRVAAGVIASTLVALPKTLELLDLSRFVDGVNPDVQP